MIPLDSVTLAAATALVVTVAGAHFIIETFVRRDTGAGRVWSVGFLSAMLTSMSYLVWAVDTRVMWGVVVGNATFVMGTGCMWLGCRRFNRRPLTAASLVVAAGAVGASVSVLLAGPRGGAWAGALWMFACLLVFAALGAVEALRGEMGRFHTARGLTVVLGLEAVFYVGRIVVALVDGFDGTLFQTVFGTAVASVLTVVLTIVTVVVTSVLRADRARDRGALLSAAAAPLGTDGVLPPASFGRLLDQVLARATRADQRVAVVSVRIDDLPEIASAFDPETARAVAAASRDSVLRAVPPLALAGEDEAGGFLLAVPAVSEADARRQAAAIYHTLVNDLSRVSGAVIPAIGVGVGLSHPGAAAASLTAAARDAGRRAADGVDGAVVAAGEVSAP